MTVVTSARLNRDQVQAQLGAGTFTTDLVGEVWLPTTNPKTLTAVGTTDGALQTAVTAAAAAFVDYTANAATLTSRAQTALAVNATFLALASPSAAQTLAQVQALTKECSALIRLATSLLDSTSGT